MKLEKLNKDSLIGIYKENERYALPVFAFIISLVLFFTFIVPQVLSFPARKTEVDAENVKLDKIKKAEEIIASTDSSEVESQLSVAMTTLPKDKPFEEALNAISTAALVSGTQLESYKFQDEVVSEGSSEKLPSLKFEVSIVGGISQAVEFVNQAYKTYPLSEVISIESSNTLSVVKINFYYKSLPSDDSLNRGQLRETSLDEINLIKEISEWNTASTVTISEESTTTASESADTGSPF